MFAKFQAEIVHGVNPAGKTLAQMRKHDCGHVSIVLPTLCVGNATTRSVVSTISPTVFRGDLLYCEEMKSPSTVRLGPLHLSPAAAGALCCAVSVLGYSTANICMRKLSVLGCNLTWAICVKEAVTVLAVGPWLLVRTLRRPSSFPTGRPLLILICAGLATELIGNVAVQWGYGIVGLAVMIPADTAFILVATAALGSLLLKEHVTGRNLAALGVLFAALTLLGLAAAHAGPTPQLSSANPWMVAAAIGAACAAGIVFALLAIAVRHCVTGTTAYAAVVVIITGTGVLTLGPMSFYFAGAERLLATPVPQYGWMFLGGVCNLIAFLFLVHGLRLTTAMHVNVINAGQVALAAVSGIVFFREPCNPWLVSGVGLMIAGIFAFGSPVDQEAVDAHV